MISTVMDSIESHQFRRFRSRFHFGAFVMAYKEEFNIRNKYRWTTRNYWDQLHQHKSK